MTQTPQTAQAPVISGRRAKDRRRAPPAAPAADPGQAGQTDQTDETGHAGQASAEVPAARPARKPGPIGPIGQWWGDMRADTAARKARADGRWWLMRWMNEQPTSMADYLHFVLHERYQRRDGRKGWGLTTEAMAIDGTHAFLFRFHGLTLGLAFSLITYALGWICQRPGRFYLLLALAVVVLINLDTWLAG